MPLRGTALVLDSCTSLQPFGSVCELIPQAERVDKLCAVCAVCGKDAAFTRRLCDSQVVELVGGAESYIPACRACFQLPKTTVEAVLNGKTIGAQPVSDEPTASAGNSSPISTSPAVNPAATGKSLSHEPTCLDDVRRELLPSEG